jgi:hypothetical protein
MTSRAPLFFLPLASFPHKRESILILVVEAKASTPPTEERVTFFAGAKKVTKETPFKSKPPQEDMLGYRKRCAKFHGQLGFRKFTDAFANSQSASNLWGLFSTFENERSDLRQKNRPSDSPTHFRFAVRQTWARSDSKRCFFGDFLCTSKESYPPAAGQRKHWLFSTDKFKQTTSPLFPPEKRKERSAP